MSLMIFGRETVGAIVVGTGVGMVGTGVEMVVGGTVGMVVGTGVNVGWGWAGWEHPATKNITAIAQASATRSEFFIRSHTHCR